MSDSSTLPGLRSWPNMPPEWFRFFRDLAARPVESVGVDLSGFLPSTAAINGSLSVRVDGTLAGGAAELSLQGDVGSPGSTYYYGTGPTGAKGWRTVASALLEGAGVEFTVGSNGVITIALDAASIASLALADTAVQPGEPLPSYTVATLPSATPAGQLIYVTDESGGAVPAFSDGTDFRRVTDRAIVT